MSDDERLNASLQTIVQRGVMLDAEQGAVQAWLFMQQSGVSETIILRVLGHPQKRRDSDAAAVERARKEGFAKRRR
jgi:hypothetical protein